MKITTFETAKVGDKVWCMESGWGEVKRIDTSVTFYPIDVYFPRDDKTKSYTVDGKVYDDGTYQTLFWGEIVIEAPEKPMPDLPELAVDTKVIVWDSITPKTMRYFSHFNSSGKMECFNTGLPSWSTEYTTEWDNWELAE